MLIAFHKPYGVLSQFTPEIPGQRTLAEFGFPKNVYPIGRLDADSEGLLLLSDEPGLNDRLLHPNYAHQREYWAQVERVPTSYVLEELSRGVVIQGRKTLPCRAWVLNPQPLVIDLGESTFPENKSHADSVLVLRGTAVVPKLPRRDPPIRFRKNVPTCWIGIELIEGKNRQVRRMTAAIGHPTLRLVRVRIGQFWLNDLPCGKWRPISSGELRLVFR